MTMHNENEPSRKADTGAWLAEIDKLNQYWDGTIGVDHGAWTDNPTQKGDGDAYTRERALVNEMWGAFEQGKLDDEQKATVIARLEKMKDGLEFQDPNAQEHAEELLEALRKSI